MNTIVGLEASLHTYVGEEIGELTKNDSTPVLAFDVESDGEDEDAFALGDFDPEELLKSPLLNNSTNGFSNSLNGFSNSLSENSFGTYEVEDVIPSKQCSVPTNSSPASNSRSAEFTQLRNYDVLKNFSSQQPLYSTPSRTASMTESETSSDSGGAVPPSEPTNDHNFRYENQPVSPSRQMDSIKQASMLPDPMTPTQQVNFEVPGTHFQSQVSPQQSSFVMQLGQEQQVNYGMKMNGMMMNGTPSLSCPPQQANNYCSPNQSISYLVPNQSNSFCVVQSPAASYSQPMQMSQNNTGYGSLSHQSSAYGSFSPQQVNQLQQMQQYISNNVGLSQTVHGEPFRRSGNTIRIGGQGLSHSLHGNSLSNSSRSSSCHGTRHFGVGGANYTNVSISADIQASKAYAGEHELTSHSAHAQAPAPLNEAMEKLCESMKRSAMSRTMIKQYSGRGGMMKQGSSRGLTRQNSGRFMEDGGNGRGTPTGMVPIRRVSLTAKHQLQHPSRGVYRHDSQQSLNGCSNHNISLHMDGRNMGTL